MSKWTILLFSMAYCVACDLALRRVVLALVLVPWSNLDAWSYESQTHLHSSIWYPQGISTVAPGPFYSPLRYHLRSSVLTNPILIACRKHNEGLFSRTFAYWSYLSKGFEPTLTCRDDRVLKSFCMAVTKVFGVASRGFSWTSRLGISQMSWGLDPRLSDRMAASLLLLVGTATKVLTQGLLKN